MWCWNGSVSRKLPHAMTLHSTSYSHSIGEPANLVTRIGIWPVGNDTQYIVLYNVYTNQAFNFCDFFFYARAMLLKGISGSDCPHCILLNYPTAVESSEKSISSFCHSRGISIIPSGSCTPFPTKIDADWTHDLLSPSNENVEYSTWYLVLQTWWTVDFFTVLFPTSRFWVSHCQRASTTIYTGRRDEKIEN